MYIGPDDTYVYYLFFENAKKSTFNYLLFEKMTDPFYGAFSKLSGILLGGSFQLYLLFIAFIYVGSFSYIIYKKSPNIVFSYIVFLTLLFGTSLFIVRQSIALAILVFSYDSLKNRKIWRFLIIVLIASLFHKTALIFLIAFPVSCINFNKKVLFVYLAVLLTIIFIGNQIVHVLPLEQLDQRILTYKSDSKTLSYAGLIQMTMFLIFAMCFKQATSSKYSGISFLYHLLCLAMVFQAGTNVIAEFFRIALYFKIFLVVFVPFILNSLDIKNRNILTFVLGSLLVTYYLINAYTTDYCFYWDNYIPKYSIIQYDYLY